MSDEGQGLGKAVDVGISTAMALADIGGQVMPPPCIELDPTVEPPAIVREADAEICPRTPGEALHELNEQAMERYVDQGVDHLFRPDDLFGETMPPDEAAAGPPPQ